MSANDGHEWIRREIDWLGIVLKANIPFLGLCLGAQLMARQLGAAVFSFQDRRSEIGYYPLCPTRIGASICCAEFPRHAYQWHCEGFDLPAGSNSLADGFGDFPNQAYIYGHKVVGLQFHPEVTYQMMCRWTVRGAERLTLRGARPRNCHLGGWFEHDPAMSEWLSVFLAAWASETLNHRPPSPEYVPYAIAAE